MLPSPSHCGIPEWPIAQARLRRRSCDDRWPLDPRLRRNDADALAARQHADIVGVDEVGRGPAVEVVFGHARIGKFLPALGLARMDRAEEGEAAYLLMAARVVDLV